MSVGMEDAVTFTLTHQDECPDCGVDATLGGHYETCYYARCQRCRRPVLNTSRRNVPAECEPCKREWEERFREKGRP